MLRITQDQHYFGVIFYHNSEKVGGVWFDGSEVYSEFKGGMLSSPYVGLKFSDAFLEKYLEIKGEMMYYEMETPFEFPMKEFLEWKEKYIGEEENV